MKTYDYDTQLPPLPLPTTEETAQGILKILTPFLPQKDSYSQEKKIEMFMKDSHPNQISLEKYRENLNHKESWLRDFWDDQYLSDPTAPAGKINYAFQLNSKIFEEKQPVADCIYRIIFLALKLEQNELPPEKMRDTHLSMDMFQSIFYSRIPSKEVDLLQPCLAKNPIQISVVYRGNWYTLTVSDSSGHLASPAKIQFELNKLMTDVQTKNHKSFIGAMTTLDSASALSLRQQIVTNTLNRLALKKIENSLFTLCIEDKDNQELAFGHRLLYGNSFNRWFYKSLQLITDGEEIGVNLEHSGCDGSVWDYFFQQFSTVPTDGFTHSNFIPETEQIAFDLSNQEKHTLQLAHKDFQQLGKQQIYCGKKIKTITQEAFKNRGISPDGCLQLAFLGAYYQLKKDFCSVYEAIAMRQFYQGRTDCGRTATQAAMSFIQSFQEKDIDTSPQELRELLSLSLQQHKELIFQAKKGNSPERHLLALSLLQRSTLMEPFDILKDPVWIKATESTLSTSSIGGQEIEHFIFSPVTETGIGVGYSINKEELTLSVMTNPSSNQIHPEIFVTEIETFLKKLLTLVPIQKK